MYMVDYDGENLSKSYHSIPEEIKKKIELKVEEIVNDMKTFAPRKVFE